MGGGVVRDAGMAVGLGERGLLPFGDLDCLFRPALALLARSAPRQNTVTSINSSNSLVGGSNNRGNARSLRQLQSLCV